MPSLPRGAIGAIVTVATAVGALAADPVEPAPLVPAETDATAAVRAPLVVAGIGGLRWEDVSPELTPTLWRLLDDGADVAAVTVYTNGRPSCPDGGWLSVSAGRPVTASSLASSCLPLPDVVEVGGGARVIGWTELAVRQAATVYHPRIGTLGSALAASGVCATAVGPGAALALADLHGSVARYSPELGSDAFDCPLTVVDLGPTSALEGAADRPLDVDVRLGELLDQLDPEVDLLITSVSSPTDARLSLGVGVVVPGRTAEHPEPVGHLLTTASTRWDGVVRLLDLPPTIAGALGIPEPTQFNGSPIIVGTERGSTDRAAAGLADLDRIDDALRTVSSWFVTTLGVLSLLLIAMSALVLRRRTGGAPRTLPRSWPTPRALQIALLTVAAAPMAACVVGVVPWSRSGSPVVTMGAAIAVIALAVAYAGQVLSPRSAPTWSPALVVSGLTVAALLTDAVLGAPLQRLSPLGPSIVTGGRYYGIGNTTFAVLAADAVIFAGAMAASMIIANRRIGALIAVVTVGAVTVLIDIWPTWGADLGGGPALLTAFAVLVLLVSGARMTWLRAVLGAAGVILVLAGIALLDWLRPPSARSHAGRFVQSVLDGDAWETVERKATFALATTTRGLIPLLSIAVLLLLIVWVRSPERFAPRVVRDMFQATPTFRATCVALVVVLGLGALANDYGVRVITIGLTAGLPLLVAMALAALRDEPHSAPDGDPAGDQEGGKLPARGSSAGTSWPS